MTRLYHQVIRQLVSLPPGWQAVYPQSLAGDVDPDELSVGDLAYFEPIACLALVEIWDTHDDDPLDDDAVIPIPGYPASRRQVLPVIKDAGSDYEFELTPSADAGVPSPMMLLTPEDDWQADWVRKRIVDYQRGIIYDEADDTITIRVGDGQDGIGHMWIGPTPRKDVEFQPDGSISFRASEEGA
jgi:hypothetical protein